MSFRRRFFLPVPAQNSLVMKQQIGYLMQLFAMGFLPLLIIWQLNFGFRLILMPALTIVAILVFSLGHKLRES